MASVPVGLGSPKEGTERKKSPTAKSKSDKANFVLKNLMLCSFLPLLLSPGPDNPYQTAMGLFGFEIEKRKAPLNRVKRAFCMTFP